MHRRAQLAAGELRLTACNGSMKAINGRSVVQATTTDDRLSAQSGCDDRDLS